MHRRPPVLWLCLLILLIALLSPGVAFTQGGDDATEEPGRLPDGEAGSTPASVEVSTAAAAFTGSPAYDSGWVPLSRDTARTLTHDLGGNPDDYVVDMQYRASDVNGINLRYYGGADFGTQPAPGHNENDRVAAYWRTLTDTSITVYRRPEDSYAEEIRIRIWVAASPDYDSGWLSLTPGAPATTLNHSIGGDPDDYVVYMEYRDISAVNQRYYGGADFGATAFDGTRNDDRVALYWRSLTNSTITLFRRAEDDYADDVRIRIWVNPRPTYDSGWVDLSQDQAKTLAHNVGGSADDYVVDMQYKDTDNGNGVNQRHFGGMDVGVEPAASLSENDRVGAYWRTLTEESITVYRRPEDIHADQVRIRIWHAWQPARPDYDSGWTSIDTENAETFVHDLGGDPDQYLVVMQYRASDSNGINLRYYGGADFGTQPAPGHSENDRVAAYWRTLTDTSITVFRRAEDDYAPKVRIRIWVMPKPDYDSGWFAQGAGAAATTLAHDLGGDTGDYLVDFQYRDGGNGVNQRYYGGADFGAQPAPGANENDRVGAYWRTLTTSTVSVYRRPDDIYAPELRLRIWRVASPDYDSDWVALEPDEVQELAHTLGGFPETYLVDMHQRSSDGNGVNQRHFGGADFGNLPPLGYSENDRVGAYWRSLDASSVHVYRRPEDGFSDWVRVRIWDYAERTYIPLVRSE